VSSLNLSSLGIEGLVRVSRRLHSDQRGVFARLFCAEELGLAGWSWPVAQVNHSVTYGIHTVRGLHYQAAPSTEAKLVSCVAGDVWDVAVDLRRGSPTYMDWHGERLSADDGAAVMIAPGFAHGFQTLSEHAVLIYCHSAPYDPAAERGLHPLDPRVGIEWPHRPRDLSNRDAAFELIGDDFEGIVP
jgi:dTDP-4-dehydrorhamnose 3,5-epimerase